MEEVMKNMNAVNLHLMTPLKVLDIYDGMPTICYYQYKGFDYISFWFEEKEDYMSWFYLQLTQEETNALKMKELDLFNLFKGKKVIEVASELKSNDNTKIFVRKNIKFVREITLKDGDLPNKGFYLDFLK